MSIDIKRRRQLQIIKHVKFKICFAWSQFEQTLAEDLRLTEACAVVHTAIRNFSKQLLNDVVFSWFTDKHSIRISYAEKFTELLFTDCIVRVSGTK